MTGLHGEQIRKALKQQSPGNQNIGCWLNMINELKFNGAHHMDNVLIKWLMTLDWMMKLKN